MKRQAYYILDPSVDQKQEGDEFFDHTWNWVRADPSVKLAEGFVYRRPIPDAPTPDDGWIPWGGGECPVDPDTFVEIRLKDGDSTRTHAKKWNWGQAWNASIIAYRIVKAPEPQWLPLTCDDVPPGSVFTHNEWGKGEYLCPSVVDRKNGIFAQINTNDWCEWSWEFLAENCQIKRPGEDWQPCKKLK